MLIPTPPYPTPMLPWLGLPSGFILLQKHHWMAMWGGDGFPAMGSDTSPRLNGLLIGKPRLGEEGMGSPDPSLSHTPTTYGSFSVRTGYIHLGGPHPQE